MNTSTNETTANNKYNRLFQGIALLIFLWMFVSYLYDHTTDEVPAGAILMREYYHPAPAYMLWVFAGVGTLTSVLLLSLARHPQPHLHIGLLSYDKMNAEQKRITADSLYVINYLIVFLFASVCLLMVPQVLPQWISLIILIAFIIAILFYSVYLSIRVHKASVQKTV